MASGLQSELRNECTIFGFVEHTYISNLDKLKCMKIRVVWHVLADTYFCVSSTNLLQNLSYLDVPYLWRNPRSAWMPVACQLLHLDGQHLISIFRQKLASQMRWRRYQLHLDSLDRQQEETCLNMMSKMVPLRTYILKPRKPIFLFIEKLNTYTTLVVVIPYAIKGGSPGAIIFNETTAMLHVVML